MLVAQHLLSTRQAEKTAGSSSAGASQYDDAAVETGACIEKRGQLAEEPFEACRNCMCKFKYDHSAILAPITSTALVATGRCAVVSNGCVLVLAAALMSKPSPTL